MHGVSMEVYEPAMQWFMAVSYVINLGAMLAMVLAMVRVAKIELPFRHERYGRMFTGEGFSPALYSWSGRVKKTFKVAVLAFWSLLGLGGWLTTIYFTWLPAYKWAGWGLAPDSAIAGIHLGVGVTLLVLIIVRGIRSVRP